MGQDGVIAIGDTAEDGGDHVHIGRHVPADRIATPIRIGPRPIAAIRRTGLPARQASGDAVALAWRLLDHLLDPHFDLPASREVVLIEEALGGTESELCQPHRRSVLVKARPTDIGDAVIPAMNTKAVQVIVSQPMGSWMARCRSAIDRLSASLTRRQTAG
jgi:hypothetical protein